MPPPAADRVGPVELRHGLVDVERARERGLGRDAVVAQPREPAQQHVDLDLRALGRLAALGVAAPPASSRRVEHGRTDAAQHEPSAQRLGASPPIGTSPSGLIAVDLGVGAQLGAGIARRALELGAHASHAADRHVPVARCRRRSRGRGSSGSGAGSRRRPTRTCR